MNLIVDKLKRGRVPTGILRASTVYLQIKAPLFVIMAMSRFSMIQDDSYAPEAYIATIDDIKAKNLEISVEICESINMTIAAGEANRDAYAADGCNTFAAAMTSTISTYWQGVAYADIQTWLDFANQKHAPHHIAVYQTAVQNILMAEFPKLDDIIRRSV
jgi:hypothetical protein